MKYPNQEEIRSLCTEQSFERGINYYRGDRITELRVDGGEVRATVRGTHDYDVSIDVETDRIRAACSCPYDYAGECKHVVAVLLAVDGRSTDSGTETVDRSDASRPGTPDIETLVEQTTADELRTFLLEAIEDDRDLRNRFLAFAGGDTGKTVYDYKGEISRLFDDAAGRGGFVEYGNWIDFSQYRELAETHRDRGHVDAATDIYRALAEAIRENFDRVDDSSGHYGHELDRAVEAYAETVANGAFDHEEKRPYIDYLFGEFVGADYGFVSDYYDEALRTLCTEPADLEYWLDLLERDLSGVSREPTAVEEQSDRERTDDVLYASDFIESEISSSLSMRSFLSTYIYVLTELERDDALAALYEDVYLEHSTFCREYAERLLDRGDEQHAVEVVTNGIETFRSPKGLRWLAADLYRGRDPETYRETLTRHFLEHSDWEAYDELKAACEDAEWAKRYRDFERTLEDTDRRRLLAMYVREGDLQKAFDELGEQGNLSLVRRYRDPVATVDSIEYFEFYRELLVPFAANDTGRRHYREIADHLEAMAGLVSEQRFEEFVDFLKETHSNRPAFLDELENAGF